MRRSLTFFSALILAGTTLAMAGDTSTYGDGVTLDRAVAIQTLMAEPETYAGQTVRIDGVVTGVCKNRGCWIHITDPGTGKGIRVKVEDGVIVFPYSSMGHKASAQGVFEAIKLTPEQAAKMKAQYEAEQGCPEDKNAKAEGQEGCDKDKAGKDHQEPSTGCAPQVFGDTVYLLRGTGAVISS
jgi:hypothetical protein